MHYVKILGQKSEITAGTRGASLGIDALWVASLNQGSDYFTHRPVRILKDRNDLLLSKTQFTWAKRIDGVIEVYEEMNQRLKEVLSHEDFPLVLSADHGSAGGTIAGVKAAYPDKRLGVIWIDAHADMHTPYTTPSGNLHGMPLATAMATDNLSSQVNEPSEDTVNLWERLKNVGHITPKLAPEDLIFFGVRDTELPEDNLMAEKGIRNFKVEECREKGITTCLKEAMELLKDCDILYVSFDVDSLDSDEVSSGTGTPVPNGFSVAEAKQIVSSLVQDERVKCFEMVEINPTLDTKNKMAEAAFEILEESTKQIEARL